MKLLDFKTKFGQTMSAIAKARGWELIIVQEIKTKGDAGHNIDYSLTTIDSTASYLTISLHYSNYQPVGNICFDVEDEYEELLRNLFGQYFNNKIAASIEFYLLEINQTKIIEQFMDRLFTELAYKYKVFPQKQVKPLNLEDKINSIIWGAININNLNLLKVNDEINKNKFFREVIFCLQYSDRTENLGWLTLRYSGETFHSDEKFATNAEIILEPTNTNDCAWLQEWAIDNFDDYDYNLIHKLGLTKKSSELTPFTAALNAWTWLLNDRRSSLKDFEIEDNSLE